MERKFTKIFENLLDLIMSNKIDLTYILFTKDKVNKINYLKMCIEHEQVWNLSKI